MSATRLDFMPGQALLHITEDGRVDVAIYGIDEAEPTVGALLAHGLMLALENEEWKQRLIQKTRDRLAGRVVESERRMRNGE